MTATQDHKLLQLPSDQEDYYCRGRVTTYMGEVKLSGQLWIRKHSSRRCRMGSASGKPLIVHKRLNVTYMRCLTTGTGRARPSTSLGIRPGFKHANDGPYSFHGLAKKRYAWKGKVYQPSRAMLPSAQQKSGQSRYFKNDYRHQFLIVWLLKETLYIAQQVQLFEPL